MRILETKNLISNAAVRGRTLHTRRHYCYFSVRSPPRLYPVSRYTQ